MTKLFSPYLNWISEFRSCSTWFIPRDSSATQKSPNRSKFRGYWTCGLKGKGKVNVCTLARTGRRQWPPQSSRWGRSPSSDIDFAAIVHDFHLRFYYSGVRSVRRKLNSPFLIDSYIPELLFPPFSRLVSTTTQEFALQTVSQTVVNPDSSKCSRVSLLAEVFPRLYFPSSSFRYPPVQTISHPRGRPPAADACLRATGPLIDRALCVRLVLSTLSFF